MLARSNPTWIRLLKSPAGALLVLSIPLVMVALWYFGGGGQERWLSMLLVGWTLTGIVPAAIAGRREDEVELRLAALPVGAADRWFSAFIGVFPLALIAGELIVLAGLAIGPERYRSPYLLTVGALAPAVMVAFGLVVAGWTRSRWQFAGLLGLALVACLWALLPGVHHPALELLPTGQAKAAVEALPQFATNAGVGLASLIKLAIVGLVFGLVGVVGYGRR